MKSLLTASCLAAVLIMAGAASSGLQAEVYVWTDAHGVKHFSNAAPPKSAVNVKAFKELSYNAAADEARSREDEKKLEAVLQEFEKQDQAAAPKPGDDSRQRASRSSTRQELIRQERLRLQEIIEYLENLPEAVFANTRSRQAYIGRYRYKLSQLKDSPKNYFGW